MNQRQCGCTETEISRCPLASMDAGSPSGATEASPPVTQPGCCWVQTVLHKDCKSIFGLRRGSNADHTAAGSDRVASPAVGWWHWWRSCWVLRPFTLFQNHPHCDSPAWMSPTGKAGPAWVSQPAQMLTCFRDNLCENMFVRQLLEDLLPTPPPRGDTCALRVSSCVLCVGCGMGSNQQKCLKTSL